MRFLCIVRKSGKFVKNLIPLRNKDQSASSKCLTRREISSWWILAIFFLLSRCTLCRYYSCGVQRPMLFHLGVQHMLYAKLKASLTMSTVAQFRRLSVDKFWSLVVCKCLKKCALPFERLATSLTMIHGVLLFFLDELVFYSHSFHSHTQLFYSLVHIRFFDIFLNRLRCLSISPFNFKFDKLFFSRSKRQHLPFTPIHIPFKILIICLLKFNAQFNAKL